ncbi:MAG: ABC transporter permease, partial [Phycisphaeraceae bacterium]|nr:ABC transporter permease [Phycisphaeraceae bacterium]
MILLRPLLSLLRIAGVSLVLSLSQIWANKTRSALTVIGIVIGVASVTAVIAALSGLKSNVLSEFEALGTNRLFIYAWDPAWQRRRRWDPNLVIKVKQTEDLMAHCPSVGAYSLIGGYNSTATHGSYTISALRVLGIQPAWHQIENRKILLGRPFTLVDERSARHVCLITESVRDNLRLDRDPVGQSIVLGGNQRYLVVGLVETRVESAMFGDTGRQDEVFVPFSTLTQMGLNPWQVMATSKSPELVQDAMAEVRFFFRRTRGLRHDQEDNFKVESVEYYLQQFNTIAATVTAIAGGVVGISLLVGGVGIMNIMLVSVSER